MMNNCNRCGQSKDTIYMGPYLESVRDISSDNSVVLLVAGWVLGVLTMTLLICITGLVS